MSLPNLGALRAVADRLDRMGIEYAFLGGSIVALLLDEPDLSPARPTDDVDVIIEVAAGTRFSEIEAKLREQQFSHDMRSGAPRCRWVLGGLAVDIMPSDGALHGVNTAWFKEALASVFVRKIAHTSLRLISPVAFLATKHVAFCDRGLGDYYGSHDLEDFITVIDGREFMAAEVDQANSPLRGYVINSVQRLLAEPFFNQALPGYLAADKASQQRLPDLRRKLGLIAALDPAL
jgi:hypothetical protein